MKLVINGEEKTLPGVDTLGSLVTLLGLKSDRVAIELNRSIVQRRDWAETQLREGDKLEIVHFVGGGRESSQAPSSLRRFASYLTDGR